MLISVRLFIPESPCTFDELLQRFSYAPLNALALGIDGIEAMPRGILEGLKQVLDFANSNKTRRPFTECNSRKKCAVLVSPTLLLLAVRKSTAPHLPKKAQGSLSPITYHYCL